MRDAAFSASPPVLVAMAALGVLLLLQTARLWYRGYAASARLRARARKAARGEDAALHLLALAGYDVLARQVAHAWTVRVDGAPFRVDLRADYLVARAGLRFVAEVKTGRLAVRLDTAATRRQLLEYRLAFDVDGVLLVDADAGTIRSVEFEGGAARSDRGDRVGWFWLVALGIGIGIAVTSFVRR